MFFLCLVKLLQTFSLCPNQLIPTLCRKVKNHIVLADKSENHLPMPLFFYYYPQIHHHQHQYQFIPIRKRRIAQAKTEKHTRRLAGNQKHTCNTSKHAHNNTGAFSNIFIRAFKPIPYIYLKTFTNLYSPPFSHFKSTSEQVSLKKHISLVHKIHIKKSYYYITYYSYYYCFHPYHHHKSLLCSDHHNHPY